MEYLYKNNNNRLILLPKSNYNYYITYIILEDKITKNINYLTVSISGTFSNYFLTGTFSLPSTLPKGEYNVYYILLEQFPGCENIPITYSPPFYFLDFFNTFKTNIPSGVGVEYIIENSRVVDNVGENY